jgi:hypothetical protein
VCGDGGGHAMCKLFGDAVAGCLVAFVSECDVSMWLW